MEENKKCLLRRLTEKLYGGLKMRWPSVILFAVVTAVLTALFLIVPVFKGTSFERMGVTFEAWIFFAIIIIANCKKPLEAAVKTFVFFLISQPLIYILQIPFSGLGIGILAYYKYWFIWTLLTFPLAFLAWFIKKKNWISLLILSPVLCYLTWNYIYGFQQAYRHFPLLIVMAVFCLLQVLLCLYAFTKNKWQKILGFAVPLAVFIAVLLIRPQIGINAVYFLPDDPVLTENASVTVDDADAVVISIEYTGRDSRIRIQTEKYCATGFTIVDGDREYRYSIEIYEDEQGTSQIRIIPEY